MSSGAVPLLAITIPCAGIVGLFVGSFLNVVVYRTPLGLSVSRPRSFCPQCRRQLAWWENVPVASWLALRGRCRTCRVPISPRYPLVELSTGALFAMVTWGWGGSVVSAAYCALVAAMVAVSLIEYNGQRAPLSVAAIGTVLALVIMAVGAGVDGQWWIIGGSCLGSLVALCAISALRSADPDCRDPRGHGRSALLIAGGWVGGLGGRPAVVGAAVWIAAYFACMVGAWWTVRRRAEGGRSSDGAGLNLPPIVAAPLVTALALAMAASLIVRG